MQNFGPVRPDLAKFRDSLLAYRSFVQSRCGGAGKFKKRDLTIEGFTSELKTKQKRQIGLGVGLSLYALHGALRDDQVAQRLHLHVLPGCRGPRPQTDDDECLSVLDLSLLTSWLQSGYDRAQQLDGRWVSDVADGLLYLAQLLGAHGLHRYYARHHVCEGARRNRREDPHRLAHFPTPAQGPVRAGK